MIWQVTDAKAQLPEILERVSEEGPQIVTHHDKRYVIISEDEYVALPEKKLGFVDYLLNGPRFDGVEIEHDKSPMRDIEL
ncbi:MAG: type II toxin-antitoxin system Phd/YefM family antitoxin [Thermomicrobiales bacterium]